MAGLIPLMLASGSRTSCTAPTQPSLRRQSTGGWSGSVSPTTPTTPSIPTYAVRLQLPKRSSLPAPAAIPVLPHTKAEWKKTIAEVKKKYFSKRYRACSAQCLEVLEGIKDTSQVEPVYLIYLHFYAATSLEICARPLPSTAALRATLLEQARTHFDQASALINAAEESVLRKFRPGSVGSLRTSSSCHSPSGSISSRAWTPDTCVTSPTDSVCSFRDFDPRSSYPALRHSKKVSFSLPKHATLDVGPSEPIIRPDSPTLGFEDAFYHQPSVAAEAASTPDLEPIRYQEEIELPLPTIPEHGHGQEQEEEDESAHHVARAVDRCCEHLSALRAQLARHSSSLAELLALQCQQHPVSPGSSPSSLATTTMAPRGCGGEKNQDRQARIERLRKNGWQRKRFDATRYEELCEAVLAELR
ncbi:hypothetical protein C7999DRAFT_27663 [Corynascus novoguineensis]|uniref:Uncharacterized protein n=1 Tax=Corynascus novoguineensis TaxID=1126955 RepID=A0AAN7HV58_9PEZI|nr:hypothetical protein C7999DRAFT_27663 [Corynascus novoguineensis]